MSQGSDASKAPERSAERAQLVVRRWGPTRGQLAVMAIGVLAVSNIGAWIKILNTPAGTPRVVTVAATEMTKNFIAREAVGARGPAEAQAAMEAYLAVTQDTVRRAAQQDGVLVLARECVLGGETEDWTTPVERAVVNAMDKIKAAKPVAPAAAGTDVLTGALLPGVTLQPKAEGPRG